MNKLIIAKIKLIKKKRKKKDELFLFHNYLFIYLFIY